MGLLIVDVSFPPHLERNNNAVFPNRGSLTTSLGSRTAP
jgi:hypothetical protein